MKVYDWPMSKARVRLSYFWTVFRTYSFSTRESRETIDNLESGY
jgi:hypothetical protein